MTRWQKVAEAVQRIQAALRRSSRAVISWFNSQRISALSTVALVLVTAYYAILTHRLVLLGVEPSVEAAIDPEVWRAPNTFIVYNAGAEPVVNTVVNTRCFLMRDAKDTSPATFFNGLPWDPRTSWWRIGTLRPKATARKDATGFLSGCFQNRENMEKFENEKMKAEAAREGRKFAPLSITILAAFDLSYQREVDGKSYRVSIPAWVLKDSKTGGPALDAPPPISSNVKPLLEELRRKEGRLPSMVPGARR